MTLRDIFEQNGLSGFLDAEKEKKLLILCDLLLEYNKKVNLTSLNTPGDVYAKHIADSAALLPHISGCKTLLDVGCGGGFPSLPVAILNGGISVFAMDSTKKKLDFILYVKERLGLKNISVLNGRAEELCHDGLRESFDAVTARAVASLPVLCELCIPYVKVGGGFYAMKTDAKEFDTALNAAKQTGAVHEKSVEYELFCENETAERCIIVFKKTKHTPTQYPRKYPIIRSHPL